MVMTDVTEDFKGTIEVPDIREWENVESSMLYEDLIKDPRVYMVFWDLFKEEKSRCVMDSQSMLGATYMTGGKNVKPGSEKAILVQESRKE